MQLVRSPESSAAPKLVATVEPSLPASTPLERDFEKFYNRVRARAVAHAESFIGYDAAQDAVQKATIEIWKRWDSVHPEQRTAAWFLVAVHFRVVDELRRRRRYVELSEEVEEHYEFPRVVSVAESTVEADLTRWVDQMIAAMPLRRREVWTLVRDHGFTYDQAAQTLGISVPSVHTHLQKARDHFLRRLKHAGVELTDGTIRRLLPPRTETSDE